MTFLNPAGLWLLLGIPLVILLYILKPPVKEKAVSSTFLWKLSEKFMKKKSPFRRFRRIFLLILQIVTVLTLSLIAAKPVFLRKDCTDYILILEHLCQYYRWQTTKGRHALIGRKCRSGSWQRGRIRALKSV